MSSSYHTPGVLSVRLGVRPDQLAKLIKKNAIPFERAGRYHLIAERDVETVRAACVTAGYLAAHKGQEVASC